MLQVLNWIYFPGLVGCQCCGEAKVRDAPAPPPSPHHCVHILTEHDSQYLLSWFTGRILSSPVLGLWLYQAARVSMLLWKLSL